MLSYQQQFEHFMAVSGKRRWLIPIPLPTRWISVWFLNVITSVPPTTARALIQGLKHDLLADDTALRALIPQRLIAFDDAVRSTLKEEENWSTPATGATTLRPLPAGDRSTVILPNRRGLPLKRPPALLLYGR